VVLRIDGLHAGYGGGTVLHGVSLEVGRGEAVALVGSNGAGKSTLLRAISGLVRTHRGRIRLDEHSLERLPGHVIARRGITHVPEARRIFPDLTVRENLAVGAAFLTSRREVRRRLDEAFVRFPLLQERRDQLGSTLSGGEQQVLAIARGLMAKPSCLLLDEPSLGLSPVMIKTIFAIIAEIRREGLPVLLAEQNVHAALGMADRSYVLESGRVTVSGDADTLIADPRVREAYLGL